MTQSSTTPSHLTIPFNLPATWTPDQALAVAELLDDLREAIWAHYGLQLIDEYREQNLSGNPGQSNAVPGTPDDPPL